PAAVLALNATIRTNRRSVAADDFFKGLFETALSPGELITAVEFPVPRSAAYVKFRQPASRFALVGVFVAQTSAGVRVAVTGAGPCVFRVAALEQALTRRFTAQACEGITISPDGLNEDIHASAAYRAHLIPVLAQDYVADRRLATAVFLALKLERPLFLEGEPGTGKTEIAKALAGSLCAELIRLQCYEGLDVNLAAYEWNYARQMLEIRLGEAAHESREHMAASLFSERFLIARPLLRALLPQPVRPVLLIDELDRAD